ncbi:MAG: alpha/beta hydrolase [Methylobacteriaceae bacterium]|nr:alpha/beta hydrolase [Methylobacteriaceae bacterium]MBV9635686.1 alpha/beta hydrolase [Methylobacteriaceae bacterium]MBV9703986.1 alpha/beta hydrolase [Methylobacteriaceae bacterium]
MPSDRQRPTALRHVLLIITLGGMAFASQASAAGKVGIVLMHGEQGAPGRIIASLSGALEAAGYLVQRPDMCWSARRAYEAPFPDCLGVVDDAIVKLKNLGATTIVVGGMSLGGNAAIAFGAARKDLLGVIALAPAHDARAIAERPEVAQSIAAAGRLVAEGKGDEQATFVDLDIGPNGPYTTEIATTANIYLSFFGPGAGAAIPDNVVKLSAPLLWVAGTDDPTQQGGQAYAFARAPPNPLNRYVEVKSNHRGTADAAKQAVLTWLKELAAH